MILSVTLLLVKTIQWMGTKSSSFGYSLCTANAREFSPGHFCVGVGIICLPLLTLCINRLACCVGCLLAAASTVYQSLRIFTEDGGRFTGAKVSVLLSAGYNQH